MEHMDVSTPPDALVEMRLSRSNEQQQLYSSNAADGPGGGGGGGGLQNQPTVVPCRPPKARPAPALLVWTSSSIVVPKYDTTV